MLPMCFFMECCMNVTTILKWWASSIPTIPTMCTSCLSPSTHSNMHVVLGTHTSVIFFGVLGSPRLSRACTYCALSRLSQGLVIYVDNIVLATSSSQFLWPSSPPLSSQFKMKDLGPSNFPSACGSVDNLEVIFVSGKVCRGKFWLSCLSNCKPTATPADTIPKVSVASNDPVSNASFYWSIVGALQHLTLTHP